MAYKNKFTVIGNTKHKGQNNSYLGPGIENSLSYKQTTDAVSTVLLTIPIPIIAPSMVRAYIMLLAIQSDGSKTAQNANHYHNAAAYYNGTTSASISTPPSITFTVSTTFPVAANWTVVGNNLLLNITGIAATTINWVCYSNITTIQGI